MEQIKKLLALYDGYEEEVRQYKAGAVCELGCSFCCTEMGKVDIITLEGLIIRQHINSINEADRSLLNRRISADKKKKDNGGSPPCPFQDDNGACLIYNVRPFSCRQLYSLRRCDDSEGSLVHRPAVEKARETVRQIQQLDSTGYSGHISYILFLLDNKGFRKLYTKGGFDPERIKKYAKSRGILINCFVK